MRVLFDIDNEVYDWLTAKQEQLNAPLEKRNESWRYTKSDIIAWLINHAEGCTAAP